MKGYQVKQYNAPVKRYCQTLELRDNPELIASTVGAIVVKKLGRKSGRVSVKWVFWRWKSTYWVPSFS